MANGISNFYRGDTQTYRLELKQADGTPLSLVGSAIWFTLKSNINLPDESAAIQKKITTHIDAANGITEVVLSASETDTLNICKYYYDFQLVTSANKVKTLLAGTVTVLQDVSRRIA